MYKMYNMYKIRRNILCAIHAICIVFQLLILTCCHIQILSFISAFHASNIFAMFILAF